MHVKDLNVDESASERDGTKADQLSYTQLMSSFKMCFAACCPALGYAHFTTVEPILAAKLYRLNLDSVQIGFFFSIFPVAYLGTSFA